MYQLLIIHCTRDVGISQPTAERWLAILVASNIVYLQQPYSKLYPIEMKKHADPQKKDVDAFALLDKIPGIKRGPGGVVCLYDRLITLRGEDKVIPINYL